MKKVFALLAIAGMFTFVACGPKAEEQAAETTEEVMEEAAPAEAVVEETVVEEATAVADSLAAPATETPAQ